MDNHLWLMIKSFYEFAIVVQDFCTYICRYLLPFCFWLIFGINVRESPFDAFQIFGISPVYGSGRDHFSRRPFLGPNYLRSLHFCKAF